MIELLRRTMEKQFAAELAYDKDTRTFHIRPPDPLVPREHRYRSLKKMTSATVVQLYPDRKTPDRLNNVRHHTDLLFSARMARGLIASLRRCSRARNGSSATARFAAK